MMFQSCWPSQTSYRTQTPYRTGTRTVHLALYECVPRYSRRQLTFRYSTHWDTTPTYSPNQFQISSRRTFPAFAFSTANLWQIQHPQARVGAHLHGLVPERSWGLSSRELGDRYLVPSVVGMCHKQFKLFWNDWKTQLQRMLSQKLKCDKNVRSKLSGLLTAEPLPLLDSLLLVFA